MREPVDWPTCDLLSHRAAATPDRTAVVDVESDQRWRYDEFDALVNGTAARLSEHVSAEDGRVGLLASTRVDFAAVVHATLRLGLTAVPLNVRLTEAELRAQAERAGIDLLVAERDTESIALSVTDAPVLSLDEPAAAAVDPLDPGGGDGGTVNRARLDRSDEAVVMFTSGTTGEPKGVRLTLGNLVASATASAVRLGVAPGDRWLCCLPMYHMGGLAPVLRSALYGTTLLVQGEFDAVRTGNALTEREATGVSLVPTQLTRLLDAGWRPPGSLETVLLGGAPASRSLIERALAADVPVSPTYGMTETASQVATATPKQVAEDPETVGQPLVFTDVSIVDAEGDPVGAGETGEIVVDGPTVTPGYLDDEGAAFGEHGLHTGDVGFVDDDGALRVLGRADDTIITGGESVHPEAVAGTLGTHPAVADVAVVGVPDEEWGERIVALVVPAAEELAVGDVEGFAREHLADYRVPKEIRLADELPRTASGTVDRQAVREQFR